MSAPIYTTRDGDSLDLICFNYYGSSLGGQVEAVLAANRSLDLGQYIVFPAGIVISLPPVAATPQENVNIFS